MSPQPTALIHSELARRRRVNLYVAGGFTALFLLGGAALNASLPGSDGAFAFELLAGLGLVGAALIAGFWLVFGERALPLNAPRTHSADRRDRSPYHGGRRLFAPRGEQVLLVDNRRTIKALRSLPAATIDNSPRAHILFDIRDPFGNSVYRFATAMRAWRRPPKSRADQSLVFCDPSRRFFSPELLKADDAR
ncbi:MAG TPA: hypothetical protein VFA04_21845 [Bryobacteraceae bacterium]|nr:hypothetical protein [Bryobacteraceae bacterium]